MMRYVAPSPTGCPIGSPGFGILPLGKLREGSVKEEGWLLSVGIHSGSRLGQESWHATAPLWFDLRADACAAEDGGYYALEVQLLPQEPLPSMSPVSRRAKPKTRLTEPLRDDNSLSSRPDSRRGEASRWSRPRSCRRWWRSGHSVQAVLGSSGRPDRTASEKLLGALVGVKSSSSVSDT